MTTIHLRNVKIEAFHGLHDGEEKTGNPYIINVDVSFVEKAKITEDLQDTIDYVALFEIVKTRMQVPTKLLEKVCEGIITRISDQYPFVKEVNVTIHKLQAPIKNFQGTVGVSMNKKFND